MAESIMQARQLTKRYGHALALDHVDVHIEKGQIYGLVGKNGAGKTTLMRLITAQSQPTSGEVLLFGQSDADKARQARSRSGAMIETPSFYPFLTAEQNLEYYRIQRGLAGKSCIGEALEMVGLTNTQKKTFKNFSLGLKQRLGLALAVMGHPDFLVLDEPINGLDPTGIIQFREILLRLNRERHTTILISSHILSELTNLATHYGFIDHGCMLQEITAQQIEERCREFIEMTVNDTARAAVALENRLNCREFEVLPDNRMRVYAYLSAPGRVAKALSEAGVELISINTHAANLEDYFLSLIGEQQA